MRRHVLPTAPSPTTTHLIACIWRTAIWNHVCVILAIYMSVLQKSSSKATTSIGAEFACASEYRSFFARWALYSVMFSLFSLRFRFWISSERRERKEKRVWGKETYCLASESFRPTLNTRFSFNWRPFPKDDIGNVQLEACIQEKYRVNFSTCYSALSLFLSLLLRPSPIDKQCTPLSSLSAPRANFLKILEVMQIF